MLIVYSITKRGEKSFWNRIGAAFKNRDGSLNVKLDCLPINGEMQIRKDENRSRVEGNDNRDRDQRAPGPEYSDSAQSEDGGFW